MFKNAGACRRRSSERVRNHTPRPAPCGTVLRRHGPTQCERVCVAIGREPSTLRRSYTMFDAQARHRSGAISYYESTERFIDQVSRLVELGISDVGLYYPSDPAQLATFEIIASDVLPRLRSAHPAT